MKDKCSSNRVIKYKRGEKSTAIVKRFLFKECRWKDNIKIGLKGKVYRCGLDLSGSGQEYVADVLNVVIILGVL